MKISIIVASLLLVGCSLSEEERQIADAGDAGVPRRDAATIAVPEDESTVPGPTPCERTETTRIVVDGGTLTFRIPLPCDPLWYLKDRGDPPPMESQ